MDYELTHSLWSVGGDGGENKQTEESLNLEGSHKVVVQTIVKWLYIRERRIPGEKNSPRGLCTPSTPRKEGGW